MRIVLNGEEREVAPGTTVAQLVEESTRDSSRIAVERNREIVPRGTYAATRVVEGDEIEIVTLVGGG